MAWIDSARRIVANNQAECLDMTGNPTSENTKGAMWLDHFTASMLVQIADGLNVENRERFEAMPLVNAVDMGWKIVGRVGSTA
jgi:hypothetical protein